MRVGISTLDWNNNINRTIKKLDVDQNKLIRSRDHGQIRKYKGIKNINFLRNLMKNIFIEKYYNYKKDENLDIFGIKIKITKEDLKEKKLVFIY